MKKTKATTKTQSALRPELVPGILFALLSVALIVIAYRKGGSPYWVKLCFEIGAPVLLLTGALLSAYFTAIARKRGAKIRRAILREGSVVIFRRVMPRPFEMGRTYIDKGRTYVGNIDWLTNWLPMACMVLAAAGALFLEYRGWRLVTPQTPAQFNQWMFGGLVGLCFPVLVLERYFSTVKAQRAPEAFAITLLLRMLLVSLLLLALAFLCRWLEIAWWTFCERAAAVLTGAIAAEMLLRSVSYIFIPLPPLEKRKGWSHSLIANLLQLKRPSIKGMNATVSKEFGIDLGRSWSITFIRASAVPFLISMVACGWLMTGITSLDMGQRAVYEAFGIPQTVFHPGLHIHLPWPLGQLRPVDFGTVHEIPIVFPAADGTQEETVGPNASDSVEGAPPLSAERLWDSAHPSEASYLVASKGSGQQSFEVVNIDLRVLYRIGLSDQDAYQTVYHVDTPDSLIRAAAGRMLARYFARNTIADVLGQNRERFIRGFQSELQSRLDTLHAGVSIIGVIVETIHPPPAAALAYQDVQASAIQSITAIAVAKADATKTTHQAEANATDLRDKAVADAAELVDQAITDTALFSGDAQAYKNDGAAFLFEKRLATITKGLTPTTTLDIVDDRITQGPNINMGSVGGAGARPPAAE